MPPLSRFDTLPSIHSWWSDSNPPGATISIHAVAKPLMRYLYHRQAREFVRTNQGIALSREAMETFASYLTYRYVAHGTKALVLKDLAARSTSSDAPVIVNTLRGEHDTFSELLRSPNTEVKNWARELIINLARDKSAWKSCLPWTPCTPFVDLLYEQQTCAFALDALFRICMSRAGAEAIVAAEALKSIVDLNLIHSPDSNIRTYTLATLDYLSEHESVSRAVLGVDPCARLGRTVLVASSHRDSGSVHVSPPEGLQVDRQLHLQAEKALKEAKVKTVSQVKVLLLGSGDSGKSTLLEQMRLFHGMSFSAREIDSYRQLIFDNLMRGVKYLLDDLLDMGLELPPAYTHVYSKDDYRGRGGYVQGWAPGECGGMGRMGDGPDEEGVKPDELLTDVRLIGSAPDLRDGEPFPREYLGPLQRLWKEEVVRVAWERRDEMAVPENLPYFFSDLRRFFDPAYVPTKQDILHTPKRTRGITETTFELNGHEILMVDVNSQKSERRKWIHCFQDVTSIVFFVNLSGYDQCLVEDRDTNQMQDAMAIWDSICHSQWFKRTSMILLLTKYDIFRKKLNTSDIRTFFPDFDGEPRNADQGRDYFKRRFVRLSQKTERVKEREIYIHTTATTDTDLLRVLTCTIEDIHLRSNLENARRI
ncbi:G-protein alpha subunit-domain-containing protein [Mycena galericulata]|nr:G-protein alpha subunit-domain-containing protein [Mycena galericulata]